MIENRIEFNEIFQTSVEDFEFVLKHRDDIIFRQEINGGHRPILPDERLALMVSHLETGESFSVT